MSEMLLSNVYYSISKHNLVFKASKHIAITARTASQVTRYLHLHTASVPYQHNGHCSQPRHLHPSQAFEERVPCRNCLHSHNRKIQR